LAHSVPATFAANTVSDTASNTRSFMVGLELVVRLTLSFRRMLVAYCKIRHCVPCIMNPDKEQQKCRSCDPEQHFMRVVTKE
jgi:hypothetical protein